MKTACHILLVLLISSSAYTQQYYFRGEVKDESGNPLQNAEILLNRTGYVYRTGGLGTFGIISNQHTDTLTFSFDGYRTEKMVVNADQYVNVKLKLLSVNTTNVRRDKLASLTKDLARDEQRKWFAGDESYASIVENRFVTAKKFPSTGMSLNVDRASYSNIRRFINMNTIVPPDAVRIEEMLNYFNLNYKEPAPQEVFHTETLLTDCPWNRGNQLFYINLFSKKINLDSLA
ncbi:MAG TPA: von Willebrand factor type A domain-containing protein, partial [Chitinophagaceae bacterium]|nr:von Willebrand factor type A domain-containing protein [Chitinophagaceae bacterium]